MVSIVILTHNRKETLRKSLASALALDWSELEVIVIDNVSSDGTSEMVAKEFGPRVQLIRRTVDSPTAGRNEGFRVARGEFILSIDNDMVFSDRAAIKKAVALFEGLPDVGLITFKITDAANPTEPIRKHWWHPVPYEIGKDRSFYTDYFSEGAIFVRKKVIEVTGGYDDDFFGAFEGVDLALKMIRDGFRILYTPTISSIELVVQGNIERTRTPWNYFYLRNKIWTAWKHYPFVPALMFVAPRIMRDLYRSMRYGWIDQFWSGFRDGLLPPQVIRVQRRPLNSDTWDRLRKIRRGQFCEGTPAPATV